MRRRMTTATIPTTATTPTTPTMPTMPTPAKSHRTLSTSNVPIKAWIHGVPFEPAAEAQLRRVAALPFVHKWIAVMPDVHAGVGATVGSVIACRRAVIPAAVGVDIGCGMMAVKTSLAAAQLPDDLRPLRLAIEAAVPHGRTDDAAPTTAARTACRPPARSRCGRCCSPTTTGVECRQGADMLDETPGAYKAIDDVMAAQADLVDVVATLKQIVCVKG
jgi:RNA-splicing ligase RtcB